jgi:hypothetical protein
MKQHLAGLLRKLADKIYPETWIVPLEVKSETVADVWTVEDLNTTWNTGTTTNTVEFTQVEGKKAE